MRKLMRLPRLLNLPAMSDLKLVDRQGVAPCSPACEAGDLLDDRAAHEFGSGSGTRTRV
jgi:hypothetical protein